jgi:hypothetical protein
LFAPSLAEFRRLFGDLPGVANKLLARVRCRVKFKYIPVGSSLQALRTMTRARRTSSPIRLKAVPPDVMNSKRPKCPTMTSIKAISLLPDLDLGLQTTEVKTPISAVTG